MSYWHVHISSIFKQHLYSLYCTTFQNNEVKCRNIQLRDTETWFVCRVTMSWTHVLVSCRYYMTTVSAGSVSVYTFVTVGDVQEEIILVIFLHWEITHSFGAHRLEWTRWWQASKAIALTEDSFLQHFIYLDPLGIHLRHSHIHYCIKQMPYFAKTRSFQWTVRFSEVCYTRERILRALPLLQTN